MNKEKLKKILHEDEKIIWIDGVNKRSYILKGIFTNLCICLAFILISKFVISNNQIINEYMKILLIFLIGILVPLIINIIRVNNLLFAITNKRIIKRIKFFKTKFKCHTLKSISKIEVTTGFFDNKSGNIIIVFKNLSNNIRENNLPKVLIIKSLNNAQDAYKILSKSIK